MRESLGLYGTVAVGLHVLYMFVPTSYLIAKFHYTGPTGPDRTRGDPNGPARTLSETRTDPTEFRRKEVRAGPVGSGRARVVEFSSYPTTCADFVWSGPVRSGPVASV